MNEEKGIEDIGSPTVSILKEILNKLPDDLPIEIDYHAPSFDHITIDVRIRACDENSIKEFWKMKGIITHEEDRDMERILLSVTKDGNIT